MWNDRVYYAAVCNKLYKSVYVHTVAQRFGHYQFSPLDHSTCTCICTLGLLVICWRKKPWQGPGSSVNWVHVLFLNTHSSYSALVWTMMCYPVSGESVWDLKYQKQPQACVLTVQVLACWLQLACRISNDCLIALPVVCSGPDTVCFWVQLPNLLLAIPGWGSGCFCWRILTL